MKKVVSTKKAPGTIGPYSQAVESNGMLLAAKKGKELSLIIIDSDNVESGVKIF